MDKGYNTEFHNSFFSSNVIWLITSSRRRWDSVHSTGGGNEKLRKHIWSEKYKVRYYLEILD
jgi:hypothetical protein